MTFGTPQLLAKQRIDLVWYGVPGAGLFGPTLQSRAVNLETGIARVNNVTWLGYPRETLLLLNIGYREHLVPYDATDLGFQDPNHPPLMFDIHLPMLFFDPPVIDAALARGHNVAPQNRDEEWALITTTGGVAAARLYRGYDFDQLFVLQ